MSTDTPRKPILCVDFDGVIHSCDGWKPPVLPTRPSVEEVARVIARAWGSYCDLNTPDGSNYWRWNKDRHTREAEAVLALFEQGSPR